MYYAQDTVLQHAATAEGCPVVTKNTHVIDIRDMNVSCHLYTPVLCGCEHLRRTLIGRVVRFGVLRDMTAVRGLLGVWGIFSTVERDMSHKMSGEANRVQHRHVACTYNK